MLTPKLSIGGGKTKLPLNREQTYEENNVDVPASTPRRFGINRMSTNTTQHKVDFGRTGLETVVFWRCGNVGAAQ